MYFGSPFEVFYSIIAVGNIGRKRFFKGYLKLLAARNDIFVVRFYSDYAIAFGYLHYIGTHELHAVTCAAPVETVCLRVHIAPHKSVVIYSPDNTQICSVHVYGIVHHSFV